MKIAAIALSITITWCAPAHAAWIHDGAGQTIQPYAGWAAETRVPAPNTAVRVTISDLPSDWTCPDGYRGCANKGSITLKTVARMDRALFLHELGHVFDSSMMTDESRATFKRLTRHNSRPWQDDRPDSSVEQFAEGYRLCAMYGGRLPRAYGADSHYLPSQRTHRRVCRLIVRVARGA